MHDDVTRGAYAPIEAGGDSWQREDGTRRRAHAGSGDLMKVGLTAVVLSVEHEQPVVLVTGDAPQAAALGAPATLPTCSFRPLDEPLLETAMRNAVQATTGRELGYVEQLLTDFGPIDDIAAGDTRNDRSQLSVSYMALTRSADTPSAGSARWLSCYDLLPWEDFRGGRSRMLADVIMPALEAWAEDTGANLDAQAAADVASDRRERIGIAFGGGGRSWDDQRVVDRYDLVVEAGISHASLTSPLGPAHLRLVAAGLGT